MLVIAKRDFRNPGRQLELKDAVHPDHVHMGAVFQFGAKLETPLKELKPAERELIIQLAAADCLSDGTDEKVVKEIQAAVKERDGREARQAARLAAPVKATAAK